MNLYIRVLRRILWILICHQRIYIMPWDIPACGRYFPSLVEGMGYRGCSLEEIAEAEERGFRAAIIIPRGQSLRTLSWAIHEFTHHVLYRLGVPSGRTNETIAYTVQWLLVHRKIEPDYWDFLSYGLGYST